LQTKLNPDFSWFFKTYPDATAENVSSAFGITLEIAKNLRDIYGRKVSCFEDEGNIVPLHDDDADYDDDYDDDSDTDNT